MALPTDVTPGVSSGHVTAHATLKARYVADGASPPMSSEPIELGDAHETQHTLMKTWYDAAHPGSPLPTFTNWTTHEQIHESLAIWENGRTADTTPPGVPGGLAADALSDVTIRLTWNASTGDVAFYYIRRDGDIVGIQAANEPRTFDDRGLTASTQYSYTIASRDAVGNESAQSSAVLETTLAVADTTPPATPTGLTGTAPTATTTSMSWNSSATATSYKLRRNGVVVASQAGLSFGDSGLTPLTEYSYTVTALDASNNESLPSAPFLVTTPAAAADTTPPSVPTGLTATPASSTSINLSWNASTGSPVSYTVRRGGIVVVTQAGLSYTDTGLIPATLYSYTVSATDAAGNESAQSSAQTATTTAAADTTPPSVPAGLSAVAVSHTQIDLSWLASTGDPTLYTVRRDGVALTPTAALTFSDTGRTAATAYSYTVDARDAAGNFSAQSAPVIGTTLPTPDTTAPTVPSNVAASVVSASSLMLTWTASTDAVGVANYTIRRGGVVISIQAADLPTSFIDTGLASSTLYSYTVAATDQAGNTSAQSTAATATTAIATDVEPPPVPTNLRAISIQPTEVIMAWNAVADAATYTLYRDDVIVAVTTAGGEQAVSTGLTSSTTYSFSVLATDAAGNSSARSPVTVVVTSAIIDTTPPEVPTGLRSTAVSSTQINLAWDAVLDAHTYLVRRGSLAIAVVDEPFYSDLALTPATTYSYTVAATDEAGNTSAASPPTSATTMTAVDVTPPTVPTGLVATAASSTSITLSWNAAGGSAVYDKARYDIDVYDDTDVANYILRRNGVIIVTQAGLTYTDTGLAPGTTYSYTVAAVDAAGNASAQSPVTSATTQATSATTFTEPFTTALTLTWTNILETLSVATGGVKGTTTGNTSRHRAEASVTTSDMFTEVTWEDTPTGSNRSVGVMTRYAATTDTAYFMRVSDVDDNFSFWKIVNGTSTRLFGPNLVPGGTSFPGTIRLESQGTTHRCYFKGVLLGTFTDASITTGTRGGLTTFNSNGGILLDNFRTGSLTAGSADVTAPTVPGSVVATAVAFDAINVTWAASTDAVGVTSYTIRRDGVVVGTRTASPFADTGLTPSTLYSYTVTASDAAGNTSAQSTAATATTLAGAPLRSALERFSLTLPTGTANATDVVSRDALVAGYSNINYFNDLADGTGFHVRCPANGVRPFVGSTGAHTELRQVKADGSNDAWSSALPTVRTWEADYTINHLPAADPEVTLWQMNNGTTDALSLRTTLVSGAIRLALHVNGVATAPFFSTNYVPGTEFTFKVSVGNDVCNTWYNGAAQHVNIDPTADTGINYFKAGLYNQFGVITAGSTEYSDIDMREVSYTELGVGSLPDLTVTDITWSPSSPSAGQAVTFTAVVQNTGGAATPEGVVIGVQFQVDGQFVSFSGGDNASLAAGASRSFVANSVPATWTAVAGTHSVTAWVDDVNRMVETSEANNTRTETTLTVAAAGTTAGPVGTPTLQEQATGTSLVLGVPTGTASGEVLVAQIGQTQTGGSGAAPAYRSHTTTLHETGGTIPQPCTKPSGLANGDILLAFISHGNNATNQNGEMTTIPSGFATIAPYKETTGGAGFWYYKVITDAGSEPATYSFAAAIDNEMAVYLVAYSGVDTSAPIHVASSLAGTDNNDGLPLAVTTSIANTRLVAFACADDTASHSFSGAFTATRVADQNVTSGQFNNYVFDETAATAAVYSRNLSYSGTATTAVPCGVLLALKPASAGGPPSGWTSLASVTQSGNVKVDAWYKVATGSEPSTYTWTGLFNGPTTGHMQRFQGISNTTPIDVTAVTANSASIVDLVVPSITTTTANAVLIGGAVLNVVTAADIVTASGMTLINKSAGVGRESSWAYELRPTAGATGTRTWGQNPSGTAREYVGWSGALRSAGGTPPPPPPPPPPTEVLPLTGPSGTLTHVVVGGITTTSFQAVAKTSTATQVRMKVSTAADLLTAPRYSNTATPDAQGMSRLTVTGLNPFTQYSFGIECGPALDSAKRGKCKTAAAAPATVSIAFGSCLNASDSPVFGRMQARNPNVFVHCGDYWYDDGASTSIDSFRSHHNAKLATSGQGSLMRNVASEYLWSDHDSGMNNNFIGTSNSGVMATHQAVHRQYYPYSGTLPHATAPYRTFALTPRVRLIVTDTRSFKSSASSSSSATVLGTTQKSWFKALITNSTEPVIIWAQDVPWIGGSTGSDDEWFGYPAERTELGNHIDASNKHVFLLAGDAHMVAFDSGVNSVGNIPVFHAGPFHNGGSVKGGPYSGGTVGSGSLEQYGIVTVTDTGTTSMQVRFDGYGNSNSVVKTHTVNISVPAWTGPTTPPPTTPPTTPPPPTGTENFNGWTPGTRTLPPLLPNFPTAETTGVFSDARRATLTVHNGNYTASTPNVTISNLHITGECIVNASGVWFENCWIEGRVSGHSSRPIFIHCDVGHTSSRADTNDNFRYAVSVYRCNIFAGQDGIKPTGSNCVFQDNFVHDMLIQTDTGQQDGISHNDSIQMNDDTTNCRIVHNTFKTWGMNGFANPPQFCSRSQGPNWGEHTNDHAGGNVSSTIQINGTAGGSGLLIENNFFDGNPDWHINMGDPGPSTTVRGNRFVRGSAQNSAVISGASRIDSFTDNRFTDNNALIPGSSA